jgi:transketolase
MSALMKIRVIYVLTHDSIGLGEDGPTHQPVEHVASLRLIPNVSVWRPCDTVETAVAWQMAIKQEDKPSCLCLSRQNLTFQQRSTQQLANIQCGGYILFGSEEVTPELILIATGSEVDLAMKAALLLTERNIVVRVVSMPATDVFDAQSAAYKESVLPSYVTRRIAIEAGIADYWYKYVGLQGRVIGMTSFGESAPASELFKEFNFTTEHICNLANELLAR